MPLTRDLVLKNKQESFLWIKPKRIEVQILILLHSLTKNHLRKTAVILKLSFSVKSFVLT